MTKAQFIEKLASSINVPKAQADKCLNAILDIITEELKSGGDVAFTGFGTFSISHRKARTGINPRNPSQKIQIPAMKAPKFKAGKPLKEAVKRQ